MYKERMVLAVKFAAELRRIIEAQGGKYTGMETPNIQSIIDVLTIPDEVLLKQKLPVKFICSSKEIRELERGWK